MSKEKKIKEMAKDICSLGCSCEECLFTKYSKGSSKCGARKYAERAYNAGYRKQGENTVEIVRCGKCEHWNNGVCYNEAQKYLFTCRSHYCGYGTKMKGGE